MKNLKNYFISGVIGLAGCVGIVVGIYKATYDETKHQISIIEKDGKECAENYCKKLIKENENLSKFGQILYGGDNAARDYLVKKGTEY